MLEVLNNDIERISFEWLIEKGYQYICYCSKLNFNNPFKNKPYASYSRLFFVTNLGEVIRIGSFSISRIEPICKVQDAVAWIVLCCPNPNKMGDDLMYIEIASNCTREILKDIPSIDTLREM